TVTKSLKRLRRAAGEARDWDVFLAGLVEREEAATARQLPGLDFLIGYALAQRELAQAHLEEAAEENPAFESLLADTVAAVHPPHDANLRTLLDLARPLLSGLLAELDQAAAGDLNDY